MSRLRALTRTELPLAQVLLLVALLIWGAVRLDGFLGEQSLRTMLVLASLLGLAAIGQTLVIIHGGIDFSVPGFIFLGAALVAELTGHHGWPLGPAVVAVALAGTFGGAVAGTVIFTFFANPLLVTLATGALASGSVLAWTGGDLTASPPLVLSDLTAANGTTFGLPLSPVVVIWLGVAIAVGVFLHRTVSGRWLYATGANPRAAVNCRIPTRRVAILTYAVSGLASALLGVLIAGFSGTGSDVGTPFLFQGLAAVVVGGTTIRGERGDYTHTVLGALIITALTTILAGIGADFADQQILFGVLILVVVGVYGRERRLRDAV